VWLYGVKRGDQLNYSVTVDGQTVGTQGGTSKFLQVLYSNPDLPYGEHQVTLKNSGAQSFVDFDSVVITTGDGNPKYVGSAFDLARWKLMFRQYRLRGHHVGGRRLYF
jgi:hypothetical protein